MDTYEAPVFVYANKRIYFEVASQAFLPEMALALFYFHLPKRRNGHVFQFGNQN